MGFVPIAFAGGGAEKIVEDAAEDKENLLKFVDDNVSLWRTVGLEKFQDRKTIKRNLRIQGKQLEAMGVKGDNLQLILGTGNAQKVIEHANAYQQEYGKPLPIDEIVTLAEGHPDTGRTLDEYIDGIIGNVKQGKDLSQSMIDVQTGGKEKSIGEKLGLFDRSQLIESRLETFKSISGLDIDQLRALAENDLEYDELPEGTVAFPDPKKRFGTISLTSATSQLYQDGLGASGADLLSYTSDGHPLYKSDKVDIDSEAKRFSSELATQFSERTAAGEDPAVVLNDLKIKIREHMKNYKPVSVNPSLVQGTTKDDYLKSFKNVYSGLKIAQDKRNQAKLSKTELAKILAGGKKVNRSHIQQANKLINDIIASL